MQGKGLVKFFLVVFFLVVAYQFLLILPTRKVEKNARDYATEKVGVKADNSTAWNEAQRDYIDSISKEDVLNLGIKKYTYEELKEQQLALGLDLRGGMSVVMQVDLVDLVKALSKGSQDPNFLQAVNRARDRLSTSTLDYVTLFAEEYKKVAPDQRLSSIFALNPDLREDINFETSDAKVLEVIRAQAEETVERTFEKVKKRIDKFGTIQPNVTLDKRVNRIIVELPGVENAERARNYLQATAVLQFFEVYRYNELQYKLNQANSALQSRESAQGGEVFQDVDSSQMVIDTLTGARTDSFYLANKEKIDDLATSTVGLGPLFEIFTPNNQNQYYQAIMGVANERDTAKVSDFLKSKEFTGVMPRDAKFLWGSQPVKETVGGSVVVSENFGLYAVKIPRNSNGEARLEGDKVTDARHDIDGSNNTSSYVVSLTMNPDGAKIWRTMTKDNIGREVAIVLDDEVVSAPVVNQEISGGRSQISGDFSAQEAEDLANILKVGKLPARTEVIESAVVGPSLGSDNINSGLMSLIVGLLLVLAFMVVYYSTGGIISIIALFANIFFIIGSLASFGTVLTLPGIAGIVLTIGMAVDANVIIYERIREELRDGKTMLLAIKDGFTASYSAIIDANVTTILTAFVLNYFGQGPIKGFAIVLIIGVLCSLFAAVLVARLMIDWHTGRGGKIGFWTGFSKDAFSKLNIDFIGKSKTTMIISAVVILAGLASMFTRGFELGIDFKGGRSYTVKLAENIDVNKMRTVMATPFGSAPLVKEFGSANQVEITTDYMIDQNTDDADIAVQKALYEGMKTYTGKDFSYEEFTKDDGILQRSIKVGPTIADDIRQSSIYATIFALLFIFLYILLRFRKWQYGLGAVAALFHDVLFVLGLFSILHGIMPFAMEIDQAFIAAILTVVGYSINDTVVVFDRIREFFNTYTKKDKVEVINLAINNTVSRTVITSLTTLFVVLMLFIFGGGSIKGFAFALVIGIIVGTYSSVFVASPIVSHLMSEEEVKSISGGKKAKTGKGEYKRRATTTE